MKFTKNKVIPAILAMLSAIMCILTPVVPLYNRNYGYGYDNMINGFGTMSFGNFSESVFVDFYIFVGILNIMICLIAVLLIFGSIISFIFAKERLSRCLSIAITAVGTFTAFVYMLEGVINYIEWGSKSYDYTLAYIPFILQTALLIGTIISILLTKKSLPVEKVKENKKDLDGFCDITNLILFLLFIPFWLYVWIYRTANYLNEADCGEKQEPVTSLLLCLFVPLYHIFWTYKTAQRIDILAEKNGLNSDLSMKCFILSIFISIVPPILMQQKMNEIIAVRNEHSNKSVYSQENSTENNVTEYDTEEAANERNDFYIITIKKLKELQDAGVISEEEFNRKKNELLNKI